MLPWSLVPFVLLALAKPAFADDTDTDADPVVDTDNDFGLTDGAADLAGEEGGMDCSATSAGWGTAGLAGAAMLMIWLDRRGTRGVSASRR